ncbi:OsmC family protein [Gordonia sp. DT219]|uniref:OsmC family protein n=1 Tax=Gordonia sp. DT219 TaxID=3416658 RepID=UPI003CFA0F35
MAAEFEVGYQSLWQWVNRYDDGAYTYDSTGSESGSGAVGESPGRASAGSVGAADGARSHDRLAALESENENLRLAIENLSESMRYLALAGRTPPTARAAVTAAVTAGPGVGDGFSDDSAGEVVVASGIAGRTTDTTGRYTLSGAGFDIVTDANVRAGGPGEMGSALDLFVSAIVSCALDSFRQGMGDQVNEAASVEIFARMERTSRSDDLGTLILECFIDGATDARVADLIEDFQRRCRIYRLVKDTLPIVFVPHAGVG